MERRKLVVPYDEQVLKNITKNFHREPVQQRINLLSKLIPSMDVKSLLEGGLSI
jgi:hypothetical protein